MYIDLLSSINGYIGQLYVGDPNWVELWKKEQAYFIGNGTDMGFTDKVTKRDLAERLVDSLPLGTLHLSHNRSTLASVL